MTIFEHIPDYGSAPTSSTDGVAVPFNMVYLKGT